MAAIDSGLVFLPRFTTLVGETEFATAPLDVSAQAGTQFQAWRGPLRTTGGTPAFTLYIEESLDAETWALGPSTPQGFPLPENAARFFSYSFRLRWFRLRIAVSGTNPMVSCWAEGILRAGDGGLWGGQPINPLSAAGMVSSSRPEGDPWDGYLALSRRGPMPWENPVTFFNQLEAERRRIERDWASSHGGAGIPGFPSPPLPNPGVPVTPPQLQVQKGP